MQKIVDYVWSYYLKVFMRPAWSVWTKHVEEYTRNLQWSKAIVIQRTLGRGTVGRMRTQARREQRQKDAAKKRQHYHELIQTRQTSALHVQRMARGWSVRLHVEMDMLRPRRAVKCVARFWRSLAASRMLRDMREKRELRERAVDVIQRCWNGYRGRKMFWEEVRLHRVKEREKHLLDPRWVMRHDFERRGALLRLQRWWRNFLARKYFAKRLLKSLRKIMVIKIQSMFRGVQYGKSVSKRKIKYMLTKKEYGGDWVTCGKNKKVVQWTSENMVDRWIKRGVLRYVRNEEERKDPEGFKLREEARRGNNGGGSGGGGGMNGMASKLGLAGTIDTKLRLKKWRRRADVTIKQKHDRLNELRHPLEKRAMVYPFEISTLRACGKRDLYDLTPARTKQGLRRLIRAMWSGQYPEMAKRAQWHSQVYFHTKRNGNAEMKKLMHRKDVSESGHNSQTGGVSDVLFWQLLGTTSYTVWRETRRPQTLATATQAFENLLTFREGSNPLNFLQAARVSVSSGNMERALQLSATCVLEYPDAASETLSQVVFLSALVQRSLGMESATIIEYLISLIPSPPVGLDDDHILLQIARVHKEQGNREESESAALEIFSTQKRRRRLPRGIGTSKQWFASPETWLTFAKDYTEAGYDLAALDAAREALRLATAKRSGIDLSGVGDAKDLDDQHHHDDDSSPPLVLYEPKEGVTLEDAIRAATRIQSRYRVRRGQLAFHLKQQAIAHLCTSLSDEVPYIQSLYQVGLALWRTGEVEQGRNNIHISYVSCTKLCDRLSSLNLLDKYAKPLEEEEGGDGNKKNKKNKLKAQMLARKRAAVMTPSEQIDADLHKHIYSIVMTRNELTVHLSRLRSVTSSSSSSTWTWVGDAKMSHSTFYAALAIQSGYRAHVAQEKIYQKKLEHSARTVQHLWVNRHEIRAFANFRRKMWAIKMVQRAWRNRMTRMILTMVTRRREGRQRINRSMGECGIRVKLAVRKVGGLRDQARRHAEDILVGKMEFRRTVLFVSDQLLMNGKDPLCELKTMFVEWTTDKDRAASPPKKMSRGREAERPSSRSSKRSLSPSPERGRPGTPGDGSGSGGSGGGGGGDQVSKRLHKKESTMKSMGFKNFLMTTTVCDQKLTMVLCDIAFAKAAASHSKSSTVLTFSAFVHCLSLLAKEKWPELFEDTQKKKSRRKSVTQGDGDSGSGGGKRKKKKVKKMTEGKNDSNEERSNTPEKSLLEQQRWRSYTGLEAVMLKLVHEHCLRHVPVGDDINVENGLMKVVPSADRSGNKNARSPPRSPPKSSPKSGRKKSGHKLNTTPEWSFRISTMLFNRAEKVVQKSIVRIQNFVRIENAKANSLGRRMARVNREKNLVKGQAAIVLQSKCARRWLSRVRVQKMARNSLTKWIDFNSGDPYWCSPTTKHQFWTKPLVLGNDDVRHVVESPHPEVEYALSCSDCGGTAKRYCNECDEWFCLNDYKKLHRTGKRAEHTFVDMDICIECSYQIASRNCDRCGDNFCDNCYYVKHRLGRMRLHTWKMLIPMCTMCDGRTNTTIMGDDSDAYGGASATDVSATWFMLDDVGATVGPFTVEVMVGLFRANRIKVDDLVCPDTTTGWIKASESGLSKHGITATGGDGGGGAGSIEKWSAMRQVYAARVQCNTHEFREICNVCRNHEMHVACEINEDLPVGTTATVNARKEEERLRQLALEEEIKEHERSVARERRRIGAAGHIQGWFRGYLGRQWGKRYMSRVMVSFFSFFFISKFFIFFIFRFLDFPKLTDLIFFIHNFFFLYCFSFLA